MSSTVEPVPDTWTRVVKTLRRRGRWAWPVTAAVFLLIVAAVLARPRQAEAAATVQVYPVAGGQVASATMVTPVNIDTEARTATSTMVLQAASAALGGQPDAAALARTVRAEGPERGQYLVITARTPDPETAAQRANAVAAAYLHHRRAQAQSLAEAAVQRRERGPQEHVPELNVLPGQVVDVAVPPDHPAWPGLLTAGAAGLLPAGAAGWAAAALAERRAPRLQDPARWAQLRGAAVLRWKGDDDGAARSVLGAGAGAGPGPGDVPVIVAADDAAVAATHAVAEPLRRLLAGPTAVAAVEVVVAQEVAAWLVGRADRPPACAVIVAGAGTRAATAIQLEETLCTAGVAQVSAVFAEGSPS